MSKKPANERDERLPAQPQKQLIPQKGEEYLREVANIEDMPGAEEQDEVEKASRETKK